MNTIRPLFEKPSLQKIVNGDIVVWEQALQQLELFDSFVEQVFSTLQTNWSTGLSENIRERGLNKIHEFLSIPELLKLNKLLLESFSNLSKTFFQKLVPAITENNTEIHQVHVAKDSWVRIMTPEACKADYLDLLDQQFGHLIVHNPHKDSWFSQAINVVNCWIAIGPVRKGNSMLIYPHSVDSEFEMDGLSLSKEQALNPPLNFNLDPGSILFFNGDYLHSSELNFTSETRFVISFRMLLGSPEYYHDNLKYTYEKWTN